MLKVKNHIPIFIINLKRSVLRKKRTAFQLDRLGLTYEFIEGVDGQLLDEKTIQNAEYHRDKLKYSRPFNKGEIGCALSHLNIYEKICKENISHALILEDDVLIDTRIPQLLNESILSQMPQNWGLLFCAYWQTNIQRKLYNPAHMKYSGRVKLQSTEGTSFIIGIPTNICYCAGGYIITQKTAKQLYEVATPPVKMPADHLTGNSHMYGVQNYMLKFPYIRQHTQWGSISSIKVVGQNPQYHSSLKILTIIRKNAKKNIVWHSLYFILRIIITAKNALVLTAHGEIFFIRFLRKIGILPQEKKTTWL